MFVGYARTSTSDQIAGLEAQVRDLIDAGCQKHFTEQISSVSELRPMLVEVMSFLSKGDVLVVTKPDRLARSTLQLLEIVNDLEKRGVGLIILSMGGERLDTRNPTSKLMLTILAGVATWEREIMLDRQREGIAKAKVEGKYRGRKPTVGLGHMDAVREMVDQRFSKREMAKRLGVHHNMIGRIQNYLKVADNSGFQDNSTVQPMASVGNSLTQL